MSQKIDPATGLAIGNLPKRGRITRLEPSSLPIEHLRWDWFPVSVPSGKEQLARLLLEAKGLATFCPMEVVWRNPNRYARARREKRRVAYPWHPGVVFVGLPRRRPYPWHLVMNPTVVRYVISTETDRPRRLRHEDVGRLLRLKDTGRFIRPEHQRWMPTHGEFDEGDTVRVIAGPLEGKTLKVEAIRGRMAEVFTEFFGATRGFEIPLEHLERDE